MNSIVLSGYISTDVELKNTPNGIAVTKFNVAVKRPKSKNDETDFIPIVCWRNTAEFVSKYFRKGDGIEIRGMLTIRKYQDNNGNNRYATEVIADEVDFGKSKKSSNVQPTESSVQPSVSSGEYTQPSEEDLPF